MAAGAADRTGKSMWFWPRLIVPSRSSGAIVAGNRFRLPTEGYPRSKRASSWLITHSPICSPLMLAERYPYRSDIRAFHTRGG